ncbi:MAG: AmmeMemoRadiSam system protein B [Sandaracinaceae bacterium]|nr:AmmeMemoRadiSam system protein B [Sandaracinaceae bacterium]
MHPEIRPPAVAGLFYPRDPEKLNATLDRLFIEAEASLPYECHGPSSLLGAIVPHAGYMYSGPVAAKAFSAIAPALRTRKLVALFGPAHRVPVRGMALSGASGFETPLGVVPIDAEATASLLGLPGIEVRPDAHASEHALEVQLPFIQRLASPPPAVLPIVVGSVRPEDVARVIAHLVDEHDAFIIVSSDLSHYLPYEEARIVDRSTAERILHCHPVRPEQACGAYPLNGLLLFARSRNLEIELLDLRSSGDTAGPRDQVVGYGAFVLRYPQEKGRA